ncbi:MAG: ribonuclease III [Lachnospiraceae bacterium]|nr:ribonuclease III [Lachnospiraceae bacterium]
MVVRTYVVSAGNMQVEKLHKKVTGMVRASSQAAIARHYVDTEEFTEDELAVFKRGRNSKSHTIPKNAEPADYRRATGLEAVIGYLYLDGQSKRAEELILKGIEYLAGQSSQG